MKQILSVFMKRLAIALGLAALMIGSLLLARGEGQLIGALFLGYSRRWYLSGTWPGASGA